MSELIRFFRNIDPQFYICIFGLIVTGIGIYNPYYWAYTLLITVTMKTQL